ncbi:MAG: GntR family transcriptional regulator [Lachnospiraceae bacterium]|nr:GntR family transcriptional regulator [Lachnospiraceae bacterium]
MGWNFDNDRPIYTQLLELIEMKILAGEYELGAKLPSVRELATDAGVNPNTMQRAMQELERKGLVNTNRTVGRTVTTDVELLDGLREDLAKNQTKNYIESMKQIGMSKKKIVNMIEREYGE